MTYIVSVNEGLSRKEFPWAVREQGKSVETTVLYRRVTATGVTFGPSPDGNERFAGTTVAICNEVDGTDDVVGLPKPHSTRMRYVDEGGVPGAFLTRTGGVLVNACTQLYLLEDGSVQLVLTAEQKAKLQPTAAEPAVEAAPSETVVPPTLEHAGQAMLESAAAAA